MTKRLTDEFGLLVGLRHDRDAVEDGSKRCGDDVGHLIHGDGRPSQRPSDVTPLSAIPHGTIRSKCVEVGGDVQRKAVAGDPSRDADADRREFVVADPRRRSVPGIAPAVDAEVGARARISTSSRSRT